MSKKIDSKQYDKHLEDALKQQDFLRNHLSALRTCLSTDKSLPVARTPEQLAESYRHLMALTHNQQAIFDDILAVQKSLLTDRVLHEFANISPEDFNAETIGAIRRAHEPMLQLIKDNESLIQKLLHVWKNLCSFLGIQMKQSAEKNIDNLEYQLGISAIHFELKTFTLCLKRLEHQQDTLNKKLKLVFKFVSQADTLSPEDLMPVKEFIHAIKKELDKPVFTVEDDEELALSAELPKPILDGVNLSLRKGVNYMPQTEYQYDWSIPEPKLENTQKQQLENTLGVEQTNTMLNQIKTLNLQANKLISQQKVFKVQFNKLEYEYQMRMSIKHNQDVQAHKMRLEKDRHTRRTLFMRPEPK